MKDAPKKPVSASTAAENNHARLVYARKKGHDRFVAKANLCNKFLFSEQWDEKDIKALKTAKRPALTINKIKPIVQTMLGEYQQNRTEVKFVPSANGSSDTATLLNKVYIDVSNDQKLEHLDSNLFLEGIVTSRAYYDVRIAFDDNHMGKVSITTPNPRSVIPDPDADEYDPDTWNEVMIVSRQTLMDIERRYGKKYVDAVIAHGTTVHSDNDTKLDEDGSFGGTDAEFASDGAEDLEDPTRKNYLIIERQYKQIEKVDFLINGSTGESYRIPMDWDPATVEEKLAENPKLKVVKKDAKVIRWTVSTGSALLHDKLSPYDHFTIVPFFPFFLRGKTSGAVEDLIDPQRNYNKLRSQELHIVNGTSNSGWKVKTGSLTNMNTSDLEQRGSMTGLVIEYNDSSDDITRIEPVKIPTGLDRISNKADEDLGSISGIQDETRGVARADVAGKAIGARRQASLTAFTPHLTNLSLTHELLAARILKLIKRFYDDERVISITSRGINAQTEHITLNQVDEETGEVVNDITEGDYNVVITSTAVRDTFDNQQFNELIELQKLGITVPTYMFVEHSSFSRKEELAEELRKASGTDTPTEEERQAQQEMAKLEMELKQADVRNRIAQATLSEARARKVMSEIEGGNLSVREEMDLMLRARMLDVKEANDAAVVDIRSRAQRADEMKTLLDDARQEESAAVPAQQEGAQPEQTTEQ